MAINEPEGTQLLELKTDSPQSDRTDNSSGIFGDNTPPFLRSRNYGEWSPGEEGVTLAWSDVSVYIKTRRKGNIVCKRIINGVTGAVKAGSLVALLGASGAGKSTLMTALAHKTSGNTYVEGDILINGRPIGDYMKFLCGFMHQEDIFVGSLTVLEHMNIMARLKLDRRITAEERDRKIRELLKHLGLTKCMNSKIGREGDQNVLSGGEKKRLAFATEILTDPPIMFCDEPTTGLDSYSAQKIVSMMNLMATGGKTILCTIHQPSSEIFAMFSQLILLAEGRIAFMGSSANALEFFEKMGHRCPSSYNPADFLIRTLASTPGQELSSRQSIKRICDGFAVSDYYKEVDVVVQYEFHMGRAVECKKYKLRTDFKEPFCWVKFYWLVRRYSLEIVRDPTIQLMNMLQKIAIAIMVGLCYLGTEAKTQTGVQSVQGVLFLLVTENTFTPMYTVVAEFPESYPLFLREYKSGLYSTPVFYVSRILSLIPGFVIDPFLFVSIIYWLSGLRATAYAFLMTAFVSILTMNVSVACGVFFSNAFDSVPTALTVMVPFDCLLMITSGVFIKLNTLSGVIDWSKYLSWLMYSTESMSIVQWDKVQNITCDVPNPDIPCTTDGSQVLEKYSFSEGNLSRDLWSMTALCAVFYLLGFLCLWYKVRRK